MIDREKDLIEKEKKWIKYIRLMNGVTSIKQLEKTLDTHSVFDLAKVFIGAQPGDYISFGEKQAENFEFLLKDLERANTEFCYKKRLARGESKEPYLDFIHKKEIKENKEKILKHFSDTKFGKEDDVLFIYFNKKLIQQQEKTYEIKNLIDKVFNIKEFLEIIGNAPILTPTEKVIEAHYLFGYYFSFPPCCIERYRRTIKTYRHFLSEDNEMYIEHVPCYPECALSLHSIKLMKKAFEITGLNTEELRKSTREHFKGYLFFRNTETNPLIFRDLAEEYQVEMHGQGGRYVLITKSRKILSKLAYKVSDMPNVKNLHTNTVIDSIDI